MAAVRAATKKHVRATCASASTTSKGKAASSRPHDRVRMALPSKGRMAEDTLELLKVRKEQTKQANGRRRGDVHVGVDLHVDVPIERDRMEKRRVKSNQHGTNGGDWWGKKITKLTDETNEMQSCQMSVNKLNPRQYVAEIPIFRENLEVWFQRASDVVRKLRYGDVDVGIVGYDMFCEFAKGDGDLMVVHDALGFGRCHLALGVPNTEKFAEVEDLQDLLNMSCWTPESPLRVVTGYHNIAKEFFGKHKFQNLALLSADGALEAAPQMGSADIILDLVSSGVTMRENNLREIEGGKILESQGVLVASRKAMLERKGCLEIVHEMIERLEAHLVAEEMFSVQANMIGNSQAEVADRLLSSSSLGGLQGPTVAPVYKKGENGNAAEMGYFAVTVVVPRKELYASVRLLRSIGGSGVLVTPLTYIFDEEPERWRNLKNQLGI